VRIIRLEELPYAPISHAPGLKKRVLLADGLSCVKNLSHAVLPAGSTAVEHVHGEAYEIFFCVRGEMVFNVNGRDALLKGGECLVVEPGEAHSVRDVKDEAEIVYFFAAA
jgi:uncharacterized cupin superfamily protein